MITSLILLNLAGGESCPTGCSGQGRWVQQDASGGRDLRDGSSRARALKERYERHRSVPSDSAVFRWRCSMTRTRRPVLGSSRAFIPSPNEALSGLYKVNADLMGFVQGRSPQREATLDMDASLVETTSRRLSTATRSTVTSPDDLLVRGRPDRPFGVLETATYLHYHSFRHLPAGVERVMLTDTAGYQQELLGPRAGTSGSEFAVGVDVTVEFRRAVSQVESGRRCTGR